MSYQIIEEGSEMMILNIVRVVFIFAITGAMVTGNPAFALPSIISGLILFFTDGWPALVAYVVGGFIVAVILRGF